jgi:hypothetical protein
MNRHSQSGLVDVGHKNGVRPTTMKNYLRKMFFLSLFLIVGCTSVPTLVASPIEKINLEDFMITINDLPFSIPWDSTGIHHVVSDDTGLSGDDNVSTIIGPQVYDYFMFSETALRFPTITLAQQYYDKQVIPNKYEFIPSEWNFKSSMANQNRIACVAYLVLGQKGPVVCTWVARYESIVINVQTTFLTDLTTIRTFQNTMEKIDAKVIFALKNIE